MQSSLPTDMVTPTMWLDATNATNDEVTIVFQGTSQNVSFESQTITNISGSLPNESQIDEYGQTIENTLVPAKKVVDTINGILVPALEFTGKTRFTILESNKFQTKPLYLFIASKVEEGTLLESCNGNNNWKIMKSCNDLKCNLENVVADASGNVTIEPFELTYYNVHEKEGEQCDCIGVTTIIFTENNIGVLQNGSMLCSSSSNVQSFTGSNNSISINCSGMIYEILLYDSELSVAQQQRIEGYLAWKWGFQTYLTSSHSMSGSSTVLDMTKTHSSLFSNY